MLYGREVGVTERRTRRAGGLFDALHGAKPRAEARVHVATVAVGYSNKYTQEFPGIQAGKTSPPWHAASMQTPETRLLQPGEGGSELVQHRGDAQPVNAQKKSDADDDCLLYTSPSPRD